MSKKTQLTITVDFDRELSWDEIDTITSEVVSVLEYDDYGYNNIQVEWTRK